MISETNSMWNARSNFFIRIFSAVHFIGFCPCERAYHQKQLPFIFHSKHTHMCVCELKNVSSLLLMTWWMCVLKTLLMVLLIIPKKLLTALMISADEIHRQLSFVRIFPFVVTLLHFISTVFDIQFGQRTVSMWGAHSGNFESNNTFHIYFRSAF